MIESEKRLADLIHILTDGDASKYENIKRLSIYEFMFSADKKLKMLESAQRNNKFRGSGIRH